MIQLLPNMPNNIAAFQAKGIVTKKQYKSIVLPEIERVLNQIHHVNFLLLLESKLENFTKGSWTREVLDELKTIGKWNKVAIITDSDTINSFIDELNHLVPGVFKGFKKEQYDIAVTWVSEETL